jgi:hypothetical protein
MSDLITLDKARQNLPSATNSDEPVIATLIAAASKAVQRYCRRDFASTSYDELYRAPADGVLYLRQYPVISVQSVRANPLTVFQVKNSDTSTNQQARVSVTGTGLSLVRVASAVKTTNTVTFAANATLNALKAGVDALGSGWTSQVASAYGAWPSADLKGLQGARNAAGRWADLKLHVDELSDYEIDDRLGCLSGTFLSGGREPAEDFGSLRVQYTAGYATVPEDVQEATAQLVATWFQNRGQHMGLIHESSGGVYAYSRDAYRTELPNHIRAILDPYRNYRV